MTHHLWKCLDCPFETSDPDARRGHETYLESNPRGWLGHGESHTLRMHPSRRMDLIIAWEQGDIEDEQDVIDLFQDLVDTGLAWQLQGMYGRMAQAMLNAGAITDSPSASRETA